LGYRRIDVIERMARPKSCPNCGSGYFREGDVAWDWMWEREDHHELLNWQCINCGAVIEKRVYRLEVVRFDPIRLAPGEFAEIRRVVEKKDVIS
jgi:hypothetical protein